MRTNRKSSTPPLWLAVFALALTALAALNPGTNVSASGDNDLGTSPFDFTDAVNITNP